MIRKTLMMLGMVVMVTAGGGVAVALGGHDHKCKQGCGTVSTITVTTPGTTVTTPGETTTVTTPGRTVTTPGRTVTVTTPGATTTVPGPTTTVHDTVTVPGPVRTVTKIKVKVKRVVKVRRVKTPPRIIVKRVVPAKCNCPASTRLWHGKCHAIARGSG